MFPSLKHFGVGAIPWSPLARGILTRPVREQTKRAETDLFLKAVLKPASNEAAVNQSALFLALLVASDNKVEKFAKKKASVAQCALAWSLSKPGVTASIVGTTSLKNLHELLGAVHITLTEEIKQLEEPYQPQPVIGHM